MIRLFKNKNIKYIFCLIGMAGIIIIFTTPVLSHGPKGHSEGDFTAFQAIKKGLTLYDKLVASGKLNESWETDLVNIEVSTETKGKKKEFVVKFVRSTSDSRTVFIFFSGDGKYIGSNFTGKKN